MPWIDFVLLGIGGCFVLHPLALFWSGTPEYAFGWTVPGLAIYLLVERWSTRPPRLVSKTTTNHAVLGIILLAWSTVLLFSRLLIETEPDWRPALWLIASLYIAAALAWAGLYGGKRWLRHFSVPLGFLFLSVPWLFNFELAIVQGLMRLNASLVAGSLVLADVPAQAAGNTILLATGRLGVEQACSGIRSLQAVVMISLFLGEFYRFSLLRRLLLLGLAALFAFAGNYARLLLLAWQAAVHGLAAIPALHDSAGLTILVFTIGGLWLMCLAMRDRHERPTIARYSFGQEDALGMSALRPADSRPALLWAAGIFFAALFSESFTQGWYAWRASTAPRLPAWSVVWPASLRDFHVIPLSAATHQLLRESDSRTGAWRDVHGWQWRALWFKYRPGTASKILFDSHNPEICLPAAGLSEARDFGEMTATKQGMRLCVNRYLFASDTAHAYLFWIAYLNRGQREQMDRHAIIYGSSPAAFIQRSASWFRDAWEGVRGLDAETLEVAISGPPDEAGAQRAYLQFLQQAIAPDPR